jgi:small-conductance mechanosensitive channel
MKTVEQSVQELVGQLILWAPKFAVGILIFLGFWIGSLLAWNLFLRVGRHADFNTSYVLKVVGRALSFGMLLLGGVTALGTMGINVSALVAGLGLTGFALGFALKDILSNLVSGILILLYRPFALHEQISVAGMEGVVTDIDLRYTRLEREGKAYLIPNSMMITNTIGLQSRDQADASPQPRAVAHADPF